MAAVNYVPWRNGIGMKAVGGRMLDRGAAKVLIGSTPVGYQSPAGKSYIGEKMTLSSFAYIKYCHNGISINF